MMSIPRNEYPRPQFRRRDWQCLNGEWQFEVDPDDKGLENGLLERDLAQKILVPFCPESSLSGIGRTDFMNCVWYRRKVDVPKEWAGRKVRLHFQAVDHDATVWMNGEEVGRHRGGFTPFTCDLGDVAGQRITLVVRARDDVRRSQPAGKQCKDLKLWGCFYMRTTGIWQTVWMEPVPDVHLKRPRITPDVANRRFHIVQPVTSNKRGWRLRATAFLDGGEVARAETAADLDLAPSLDLAIPADSVKLWGPGQGHLYDITLELLDQDGRVVDRAASYAGLRSVAIEGKVVRINGRPVFQRLIMDQGYYPDGIMTAPSDQALKQDIELALATGFNGARLTQKVFEERFLYHADRLGYLVWAEFGDCGFDPENPPCMMITQWLEAVERDYSHPSIIGWCSLCETIETQGDAITPLADLIRGMFLAAKVADKSRPVLDCSGGSHVVPESDLSDCHDYEQDPDKLRQHHAGLARNVPFSSESDREPISIPYRGQPFIISEIGGIWWNPAEANADEKTSWGYGDRPKDVAEFYRRFQGLCHVLLDNPDVCGYCYTQLTDIYQEQNGLYYFDRSAKFDADRLKKIQRRAAAIEQA